MKLEYILVIAFLLGMAACTAIVYVSNKGQKKHEREIVDKTRTDWAAAMAAVERTHSKETEALNRYIASLQDLIVEKDERIKQLENDIALKDFVMSCAKINDSFDEKKLKEMLEHISANCHEVIDT